MTRMTSRPGVFLLLGAVALFLVCSGVANGRVELLGHVIFGWIGYLAYVLPRVRLNYDTLWSTGVFGVVLGLGAHNLCSWIYRQMGQPGSDAKPRRWRARWTLGLLASVLVTFAAGTSAVAVVHQVMYLARSDQPMWGGGGLAKAVKCASQVHQILMAVTQYAETHEGRFPERLDDLSEADGFDRSCLVCPTCVSRQPTDNPATHGHEPTPSYIYLGAGLLQPLNASVLLILEPPGRHHHLGSNAGYGDGHVEWLKADQIGQALTSQQAALAAVNTEDEPAATSLPVSR